MILTNIRLQNRQVLFSLITFLITFYFIYFDGLLLTEANGWFFVNYILDFVKDGDTQLYKFNVLNNPHGLFNLIYLYIADVLFFLDSYTVSKLLLLSLVLWSIYSVYRLTLINEKYLILLPLVFSYILIGGMVNYYIAITIMLFFILRLETKKTLSILEIYIFALLIYHAHFMAYFPFMLFILYKYKFKKTVILSIIPFIFLVSYKLQYIDDVGYTFAYDFFSHFKSIRRFFLPLTVDITFNLWQYIYVSIFNILYLFLISYFIFNMLKYEDRATVILFVLVAGFYMLFPNLIPGGGTNIHERLILPFFCFCIYLSKNIKLHRFFSVGIFLVTIALMINLYISQFNFNQNNYRFYLKDEKTMDYTKEKNFNPFVNRLVLGQSLFLKQEIMDKKWHPDDYFWSPLEVHTTSLMTFKNRE